ncbi:MAG: hypothetical protein IJB86_01605 [Clostridia bacterium]|nr:hypothetical protein [Clostridia bacterium]
MRKFGKTFLSVLLALSVAVLSFSFCVSAEGERDYTIVSPYEDVIWDGENAWGAYKGNLHTHSTASDADEDLNAMILEHYEQGFDFLSMTDHGVTGVEWNKKPYQRLLYSYQYLMGKSVTPLTDEQYYGVLAGTYPLAKTNEPRGFGMTCVTGGNELNALTLTKSHVNGYFLPSNYGNQNLGFENGFEYAINQVDEIGGLSLINHPGDWLASNQNKDAVHDKKNIEFFADLLLRYDTCLGMEVFNEDNGTEPYNRELWDNLLMEVIPYGDTVVGFSNSDAHTLDNVDSSYAVFMMEENNIENIKKTMKNGASFLVTHNVRANELLGPDEEMDVKNCGLPVPEFKRVEVDGHKVKIVFEHANNLTFVANGDVIAEKDYDTNGEYTYVLDLDSIDGSEDFLYVRAQLIGEGGMTLTQALVIDDGTEPLKYERDNSPAAIFERIIFALKSSRFYCIFQELIRLIVD